MIQFFKSIPYHIKAAFKSIFRHLAMSISAASAVTVTLVLMACFLLLAGNIGSFTHNLENSVKIHVKVAPTVSEEADIQNLENQLKSVQYVKSVEFSDKNEEFDLFMEYVKNTGGSASYYERYTGENNPLRNAFIIEVTEPEQIENVRLEILKLEGVESAEYGGASANQMISAFDSIRNGGAVFILALSLLAVFLISNTIKMTIYARNEEIAIMRNVGAANWFIKTPFMIEGMVIGFMGAVIPVIFTFIAYNMLYKSLGGVFFTEMFPLQPMMPFCGYISLALVACGMAVGLVGSFFSVNKYLRWKR